MERGMREWRKAVKLYETTGGESYRKNRYEEELENGEEAGNWIASKGAGRRLCSRWCKRLLTFDCSRSTVVK